VLLKPQGNNSELLRPEHLQDVNAIRSPEHLQDVNAIRSNVKATKYNVKGQALVEYALLIGIAAVLSVGFFVTFSGLIQEGITHFNALLERDLRAGSFNEVITIWEN